MLTIYNLKSICPDVSYTYNDKTSELILTVINNDMIDLAIDIKYYSKKISGANNLSKSPITFVVNTPIPLFIQFNNLVDDDLALITYELNFKDEIGTCYFSTIALA